MPCKEHGIGTLCRTTPDLGTRLNVLLGSDEHQGLAQGPPGQALPTLRPTLVLMDAMQTKQRRRGNPAVSRCGAWSGEAVTRQDGQSRAETSHQDRDHDYSPAPRSDARPVRCLLGGFKPHGSHGLAIRDRGGTRRRSGNRFGTCCCCRWAGKRDFSRQQLTAAGVIAKRHPSPTLRSQRLHDGGCSWRGQSPRMRGARGTWR